MRTAKPSKYPGWRTMTASQRHNAKADRIFEQARNTATRFNAGSRVEQAEAPDVWSEHPKYAVKDWQYEVANNDTRAGYAQWVEGQIEKEEQENQNVES